MSNENKVEETTETNDELETQDESQEESNEELEEETEEESNDESEEESDDAADSELERLRKENKTLTIQKDKWRKKAEKPLQTKNKEGMTEEQLIKVSKMASSLDDDDLEVLATITGESIADKVDNPLFKAYKAQKEKKKRSEASALKPSSPNTFSSKKDPNNPELSEDDHRKMVEKMMKG